MKFDFVKFKITGVSRANALTILIIPLAFILIGAINISKEVPENNNENKLDNIGLANSKKTKKIISRKDVNTKKISENQRYGNGSINDAEDWDMNPMESAKIEELTFEEGVNELQDTTSSSNNSNIEFDQEPTYKTPQSKKVNALLAELEEKETAEKEKNNQQRNNSNYNSGSERTYQNNSRRVYHEQKPKKVRTKQRIFTSKSRIYANTSQQANNYANSNRSNHTGNYSPNIEVKIHGIHDKVTDKSKITVRTTENCVINGRNVPIGTFLTGITSFNDNRLDIQFTALYLNNEILPIRFQAFSQDGLKGVFIEGGLPDKSRQDITSDVVNESVNEIPINVPIIGSVVKAFARRKGRSKKIYVHLPSNYPLILKPIKQ